MAKSAILIDWYLAKLARQACELAYQGKTIESVETSTQVTIQDAGDLVIVAFRGSTDLRDWMTNSQFTFDYFHFSENQWAKVHHGFLRAFDSVDVELLAHLSPMKARKIIVTGHSLGGALALLCAMELRFLGFNVQCITFGAPRIGNADFATYYNGMLRDQTFNFVNEGDPVPLVPTLLMGYRDVGHEIFLRRTGAVEVDPFIGWELLNDFAGIWRNWRKWQLGFIPNHSLTTYQERMLIA